MKPILRTIAGLVISVVLLTSCDDDYRLDIFGSISGKVVDSSTGTPIPAAQVTLIPGGNTAQTSVEGAFSFSGLEEGQYTVSVQKKDFRANMKFVTVVSSETAEIVVELTAIPKN